MIDCATFRAASIWQAATLILKRKLHRATFEQWFANVVPVSIASDNVLTIGVADDFLASWITDNFGDVLTDVLNTVDGAPYSFVIESGYAPPSEAAPAETIAKPATLVGCTANAPLADSIAAISIDKTGRPQHPGKPSLREHSFNNFVVGEENRYAYAACKTVAQNPGIYNPLYIYGDTGIGKTHLIQAVRHEMLQTNKEMIVRYATCEQILNEFVDALNQPLKFSKFRGSMRDVDALLIDDIHALANKSALQEQFFNTFNDLYREGKQIILTSDKQPCEIQGLEKRLISRFESGLTTELNPPGYEIRLAILKRSAEEYMLGAIDNGVLDFLATNISSSVRRLKGALMRIIGFASASSQSITINLAENVLRKLLEDEQSAKTVSLEEIQSAVAEHFGLRMSDILSDRRPRNVAEPRMIAMYLCRILTDSSYPEIGAAFDKNHATVLNAMKKVPEICRNNESMRFSVSKLERQLKQRK